MKNVIDTLATLPGTVPLSSLEPGQMFKLTEVSARALIKAGWNVPVESILESVFMRSDSAPPGMSIVGACNLSQRGHLCGFDQGQFEVQVVVACHIVSKQG